MSLGVALGRHAQAFLGSLGRLARSPLATLLTLLVIALALALPLALRLLVTNAQAATARMLTAINAPIADNQIGVKKGRCCRFTRSRCMAR